MTSRAADRNRTAGQPRRVRPGRERHAKPDPPRATPVQGWDRSLGIGRRLFLGCLLIILVFLVATVLISGQLSALKPATEDMKTLSEGIRASLMLGNYIREQYVHQAHLIITRDAEHTHHVESAHHETGKWMVRMRALLKHPQEAVLLDDLTRTVETFNAIFEREIVPLVKSGENARVLERHDACEKLVTHATGQIDRIVGLFASRFESAQREVDARGTRAISLAVTCVILALGLAVAVAGLLTRSVARPIALLIEGAGEVARGNLEKTLPVDRADEFGQLATAFNAMTHKLKERQQQLMESEKLATLGRLAAAVAHELNNPLGIILGYLKTLFKERKGDDRLVADLKILEDEANQCRKIVADLLTLARPTDIDVKEILLDQLLEDTVDRLKRQEAFAATEWTLVTEPGLSVLADSEKLKQVVKNIASNAADAMTDGGTLTVRARRLSPIPQRWAHLALKDGEAVEVSFTDSGHGIPPDKIEHLFTPFFTTRTNGTGLGLFICYHILKAHGGEIAVGPGVAKGTTVSIVLPALSSGDDT